MLRRLVVRDGLPGVRGGGVGGAASLRIGKAALARQYFSTSASPCPSKKDDVYVKYDGNPSKDPKVVEQNFFGTATRAGYLLSRLIARDMRRRDPEYSPCPLNTSAGVLYRGMRRVFEGSSRYLWRNGRGLRVTVAELKAFAAANGLSEEAARTVLAMFYGGIESNLLSIIDDAGKEVSRDRWTYTLRGPDGHQVSASKSPFVCTSPSWRVARGFSGGPSGGGCVVVIDPNEVPLDEVICTTQFATWVDGVPNPYANECEVSVIREILGRAVVGIVPMNRLPPNPTAEQVIEALIRNPNYQGELRDPKALAARMAKAEAITEVLGRLQRHYSALCRYLEESLKPLSLDTPAVNRAVWEVLVAAEKAEVPATFAAFTADLFNALKGSGVDPSNLPALKQGIRAAAGRHVQLFPRLLAFQEGFLAILEEKLAGKITLNYLTSALTHAMVEIHTANDPFPPNFPEIQKRMTDWLRGASKYQVKPGVVADDFGPAFAAAVAAYQDLPPKGSKS